MLCESLQQFVGQSPISAAVCHSVVMDGCAASPPPAEHRPWTAEPTPTAAEIDARFALYEQRAQAEDEEEEEERIPDLQKDDMMARRTGAFLKQTAGSADFRRFLPPPGSGWSSRGEIAADAAPPSNKEVLIGTRWAENGCLPCLAGC